MRLLIILSGLILLTCVFWPTSVWPTSDSRYNVAEETLGQAEDLGFDYETILSKAYDGNELAVKKLLIFSQHTDAAGSLGHRVAIVELGNYIGKEKIFKIIRALPKDLKELNMWYVKGEPAI